MALPKVGINVGKLITLVIVGAIILLVARQIIADGVEAVSVPAIFAILIVGAGVLGAYVMLTKKSPDRKDIVMFGLAIGLLYFILTYVYPEVIGQLASVLGIK